MKLVIMTTRREQSYVHQTLASVLASDWSGDVVVSTDPDSVDQVAPYRLSRRVVVSTIPTDEWNKVRESRVHRRASAHYCRCLDIVATDPEGGIILEDDVIVRADFESETRSMRLRELARRENENFALLLYSSRDPQKIGCSGTTDVMPTTLFFGTQAMYWTSDAARAVRSFVWSRGVEPDNSVYDLLIRSYGMTNGDFKLVIPEESLAQHVGRTTTGMGSFHSSPTYMRRHASRSNVCVLTAGVGGNWPSLVRRVEDRLRTLYPQHTVKAFTELPSWLPCALPSVSWLKVFCWDIVPSWIDTVMWVDADVIPVRALQTFPDAAFCAVPDAPTSVRYARKVMPQLLEDGTYFNAGIWIARRVTEPMFRCLQQLLVAGCPRTQPFYEQSWLNLMLQAMPLKTHHMPRQFNWMSAFGSPVDDVVHIHRAGSHHGLDACWKEWIDGERVTRLTFPDPVVRTIVAKTPPIPVKQSNEKQKLRETKPIRLQPTTTLPLVFQKPR